MDALVETSKVLLENCMITDEDSKIDCLLVKLGVVLDGLIILLPQVSPLDPPILIIID